MKALADVLRVFGPAGAVRNRAVIHAIAREWRERNFRQVGLIAREAARERPDDHDLALLLARLHREGLCPFSEVRTALERHDTSRARVALVDFLWLRCHVEEAAAVARGAADRVGTRALTRFAALLHALGASDEAMETLKRAKRAPDFALYPRGYIRLMGEAYRRGIDRSPIARRALPIDERLARDEGQMRQRLAACGGSTAIVANGPLPPMTGARIDAHGCIVRMNRHGLYRHAPSRKFGPDALGTGFDVWFRPAERTLVPLLEPVPPHIVLTGACIADRFASGVALLEPFMTLDTTIEQVPVAIYRDLFHRFDAVPSVGALALACVADATGPLSPEQVFGFAPSRNTQATSLHRTGTVSGRKPNRHRWDIEAAYLRDVTGGTATPAGAPAIEA